MKLKIILKRNLIKLFFESVDFDLFTLKNNSKRIRKLITNITKGIHNSFSSSENRLIAE
jgi:hypothetical protein